MMRRLHVLAFALFLSTTAKALSQHALLPITDSGGSGAAVDGGWDVNGDGVLDLFAGAPSAGQTSNEGKAKIYSGLDGSPLFVFSGMTNDRLGSAVAFLGDINGDFYPDVLVGAPQPPIPQAFGGGETPIGPGYIQVISGLDGSLLFALGGVGNKDRFGAAVANAGDLDGNGVPDFLVGSPRSGFGTEDGAVYAVSGSNFSVFVHSAPSSGERWGSSVAGGQDVNGDGFDDYAFGAPLADWDGNNAGRVYVHSGIDRSLIFAIDGLQAEDRLGSSVALIADVNGDGHAEIVAGATHHGTPGVEAGAVFVFSGADGTLLYLIEGESNNANFGTTVRALGDVDHDGFEDFGAGAPEKTPDFGYVSILSGRNGTEICRVRGKAVNDGVGKAVAPAGNFDNTPQDEYIVGASGADENNVVIYDCKGVTRPSVLPTAGIGSASNSFVDPYVGSELPVHAHVGQHPSSIYGANLGSAVAILSDLNGDGFDEYLVGSPGMSTTGSIADGRVTLYSGQTGAVLRNYSTAGDLYAGKGVSSAGDVNGDGVEDFMYAYDDNLTPGYSLVRVIDGDNWLTTLAILHASTIGGANGFTSGNFGEKFALASAGDVNGDGYGDIVIGDDGYCYSGCWQNNPDYFVAMGAIWVISGEWIAKTHLGQTPATAQVLWWNHGSLQWAYLGTSVAGIGDIDGDGFDDVAAGGYGHKDGTPLGWLAGSVTVFSGQTGEIVWKVIGPRKDAFLGWSIASVGDLDHDGINDILAGAPGASSLSANQGSVQLLSGADGGLIRELRGNGAHFFGASVAGGGDLDGDGTEDFVIGASMQEDPEGPGRVYGYSGKDLGKIFTLRGQSPGARFGYAVSIRGNLGGDTKAEVLVGAPHDNAGGAMEGRTKAFSMIPNPTAASGSGPATGPVGSPPLGSL